MSGLLAVIYFLFALLFSLLSFVLWSRIALRYFHVSTLHPVSQSIHALTDPIIMPLTEQFTSTKKRLSPYDWPSFCLLVIVELFKFMAIGAFFFGTAFPWELLPLYTLADLIVQPCNILFYAIIIRVVMTWINPRWHHPLADILKIITDPSLRYARRHIPDIAGIDFSPFIVLIVLKIVTLFIAASLPLHLI